MEGQGACIQYTMSVCLYAPCNNVGTISTLIEIIHTNLIYLNLISTGVTVFDITTFILNYLHCVRSDLILLYIQ